MKRFGVLLLVLVLFGGCLEKRHIRKREKAQKQMLDISLDYPELFDIDTLYIEEPETLYIPVNNYIYDTVVGSSDTIVIENERIRTIIKPLRDIITNEVIRYRVRTEIKADTIEYIRTDTIVQINTKIETKTVTQKVKYIPWWIYLIMVIFGLSVIFLVFKLLIGTIDTIEEIGERF